MSNERKCAVCETIFIPKRKDSTACSKKCSQRLSYLRSKKHTNECVVCSKRFKSSKKNVKLCSQACINRYSKKPDIVKNCKHCGKEFSTTYIEREKKCCSRSCASSYTNEYRDNETVFKKISATKKRQFATGEVIHYWVGKKHTEVTKKKISETRIKNELAIGENNGMYGRGHTLASREKMSDTRTKKILNGEYAGWFKKGIHYSAKLKKEVHYRSSWEKEVYELLDGDDNVKHYEVEPCSIAYYTQKKYKRHYIPDLLIVYKDGTKKLIEIKPSTFVSYEKNIAKFKAAQSRCDKENWLFEVWTENTIQNYLTMEK
jgi:hypothetical protein